MSTKSTLPPAEEQIRPHPVTSDLDIPAVAAGHPVYSHEAMVELMIAEPSWNYRKLAKYWGRDASWFMQILASDGFQLVLDPHRHLITDPTITATLDERFRALTLRSLDVLQDKLDGKEVSDFTVLKAAELGVKALGMGQVEPQAQPQTVGGVDALAERLVNALKKQQENVQPGLREPVVVTIEQLTVPEVPSQ